jgi:(1->4)-alpha-D-glucan 1-alpha-D-glucosylmutase
MTSPGIPDFYQGCEFWDLTMVDPDNRKPVDFKKRGAASRDIFNESQIKNRSFFNWLLEDLSCGISKLYLIRRALEIRNENRELFIDGEYVPLTANGTYSDSIISFARIKDGKTVIVIASRKLQTVKSFTTFPLTEDLWLDTCIETPQLLTSSWRDCITEKRIEHKKYLPVAQILDMFPCALLVPMALIKCKKGSEMIYGNFELVLKREFSIIH